jgi:hypothetical protein
MFCPKCNYTTFDYFEKCPKCNYNWSETKKQLGLDWILEPEIAQENDIQYTIEQPIEFNDSPINSETQTIPEIEPPTTEPSIEEKQEENLILKEQSPPIQEQKMEEDEEIELDESFFIEVEKKKPNNLTSEHIEVKDNDEIDILDFEEINVEEEKLSKTQEKNQTQDTSKENQEEVWDIEFEDLIIEKDENQDKTNKT